MDSFLANAGANLVGTMVGAGLALLTAFYLARRDERLRDRQLLQSVFDHIWRMRALAREPDSSEQKLLWHAHPKDRERCIASVLNLRDHLTDVVAGLSPRANVVDSMDRMIQSCLDFLEQIEAEEIANPHDELLGRTYVDHLLHLRDELTSATAKIFEAHHRQLNLREAGGAHAKQDRPPSGYLGRQRKFERRENHGE